MCVGEECGGTCIHMRAMPCKISEVWLRHETNKTYMRASVALQAYFRDFGPLALGSIFGPLAGLLLQWMRA